MLSATSSALPSMSLVAMQTLVFAFSKGEDHITAKDLHRSTQQLQRTHSPRLPPALALECGGQCVEGGTGKEEGSNVMEEEDESFTNVSEDKTEEGRGVDDEEEKAEMTSH